MQQLKTALNRHHIIHPKALCVHRLTFFSKTLNIGSRALYQTLSYYGLSKRYMKYQICLFVF